MDVRLPNGTLIRNIPEGTPRRDIMRKAVAAGYAEPGDFIPQDEIDRAVAEGPEIGGALQASLISAGRTFGKLGAGLENIWAGITGDEARQAEIAAEQADIEARMAPVETRHPIASLAGGTAPYLATAPLSGGLATQTALGAALGGAEYAPNQAQQAAVGGALSALPFGIGKAITRGTNALPGRLAARADELGYPMTPAERTGSEPLRRFEAALESWPLTTGTMAKVGKGKQEAVNRIAAESLGQPGPLTDDALDLGATRIGDVFDEAVRGKQFQVDDEFIGSLAAVDDASRRGILGGEEVSKVVDNILEQIGDSGVITGQQAQDWQSMLRKAARAAFRSETTDPNYAMALTDIANAVDDLAIRGSDDTTREVLRTARQQWKTLRTLDRPGVLSPTGDVSGRTLANRLRVQDKTGFTRGRDVSDLYDVARLSKSLPPYQDSGTASRLGPLLALTAGSPVSLFANPLTAGAYMRAGNLLTREPATATQEILQNILKAAPSRAATGGYLYSD